jgi:MFS family permease
MKFHQIHYQWARFRRHFTRFTWGGAWAAVLPEKQRQNLTLFFYDGLFAAASDKIILTYITIYLLFLGATRQQIGLLSSLSNLTAASLLLPAAMLVERTGQRKRITLAGATGSRLAVLLMALLPMLLGGDGILIWIVLSLALLREGFNNIGFPGWMALTGDIVPIDGRGRYFGTRNFIMGIAGIITALVIGEAITRIGEPLGYQLSFILAVVLGGISMSFFARLKDPQKLSRENEGTQSSLAHILASLKGEHGFIRFCVFTAVWNFAVNISGPFFNVYMVDTLNMTAAMIGIATVGNTAANLLVQRGVGGLADRWGNRNVVIIFMLLIPIMPLLWGVWVQQPWQAILMQTLGGILWGAYNLVSFNTILQQTPENQRARFSALYQIVVTLSLAGGAALGSFIIPLVDFTGVTLASAGGRWLAGLLFLFLVRDKNPTGFQPDES